jgi:dihydroorotate dehydrogenase
MTFFSSSYRWMRPVLFSLPPERAHDLSLQAFQWMNDSAGFLLPAAEPLPFPAPVQVAGLSFPNPVGLAAGLDKNAAHIDALARFGFGFIEVGTVTPNAQPGNPQPRMFRLAEHQAIINRMGFNNLGLETFLKNVSTSSWVRDKRGVLGLNIGKNASTPVDRAEDDYLTGLRGVYPWADYITINISSPNTKGLRDLQGEAALHRLLGALRREATQLHERHQRRVPLFLKVAPDLDEAGIAAIAQAVTTHDIEAIIATNTTLDRSQVAGHVHAEEAGGLSGSPVLEKSNQVLKALREQLHPEVALIGVGGILSAQDGREKMRLGANLVQVYSGLIYRGPQLVSDLVAALSDCQRA